MPDVPVGAPSPAAPALLNGRDPLPAPGEKPAGRVRARVGARVGWVGARVPERVVPNAEIAGRLGISEDWIVSRTGVRERHVIADDERLSTLAADAGRQALDRAGIAPEALDLLLVATASSDELMPNAAPLVARELGAGQAAAIDVGAACTGFVSALSLGAAQIEAGRARHALVIGADVLSRHLDLDDRRTAALFGDGAGAVVLGGGEGDSAIFPAVMHSDGTFAEHITIGRTDTRMRMQGHETFKWAVTRLSEVTLEALAAAELELADIDLFVYHQANSRILRAVGERLSIPGELVVDTLDRYANTSAASIPLALAAAEAEGRLENGMRVLLAAFGAGFTWGGLVVEWGARRA